MSNLNGLLLKGALTSTNSKQLNPKSKDYSLLNVIYEIFSESFLHLLIALVLNLVKNDAIIKYFLLSSRILRFLINSVLLYCYGWIIRCCFVGLRGSASSKGVTNKSIAITPSDDSQENYQWNRNYFELIPRKQASEITGSNILLSHEADSEYAKRPFLEMKTTFFDREFQFAQSSSELDRAHLTRTSQDEKESNRKIIFVPVSKTLSQFSMDANLVKMEFSLRKWLSKNIFVPLWNDIQVIERSLPKTILSSSSALTTNDLFGYFAGKPEFQEANLLLTKMLPIFERSSNFALLSQSVGFFFSSVKELSTGNALELYRWSKNVISLQEKISYAELLMGLFCSYMDFCIPAEEMGNAVFGPFTKNHYLSHMKHLSMGQEQFKYFAIRESQSKPVHYDVVLHGNVYECLDGPSNVFMAILVFLSLAKSEFNGYLGLLSLKSQSIDNLMSVIEQ